MSAHVLLNLLNTLRKVIKCAVLPSNLPLFCNEFEKSHIGAPMLDSIYHMKVTEL